MSGEKAGFSEMQLFSQFPGSFRGSALRFSYPSTETGISKNYYATNSGSPEVELRFCTWLILLKY
jgi:hypothetical protein